jgi:hypothetical protein
VKALIRKVSVLSVLFSGLFLLIGFIGTTLVGVSVSSLGLLCAQVVALLLLALLLAVKIIQIY